jgi:hypothetical protein
MYKSSINSALARHLFVIAKKMFSFFLFYKKHVVKLHCNPSAANRIIICNNP